MSQVSVLITQPHGPAIKPSTWRLTLPTAALPREGDYLTIDGGCGGTVMEVWWELSTEPGVENPVLVNIKITEG